MYLSGIELRSAEGARSGICEAVPCLVVANYACNKPRGGAAYNVAPLLLLFPKNLCRQIFFGNPV